MFIAGNQELDANKIIDAAKKWDDKYLKGVTHAVHRYNDPQDARALIQEFLSRKNSGAFRLTNPFSKQIWLRQLIPGYVREDKRREFTNFEGDITCALATFTHEDWACPDTNIAIDLGRAKQKVRNALTTLSFIATFEAAYYTNEEWEKDGHKGKLVCFHCHAVLWATNRAQLSRLRTRINPRFKPILGNKSGVRFDRLKRTDDVCRALAYQAKMPVRGYRTELVGWGKKRQRHANLSYRSRYRLFMALQRYDLLDFWLAGGEGAQIVDEARSKLNEYRDRKRVSGKYQQEPPWSGPSRRLHLPAASKRG